MQTRQWTCAPAVTFFHVLARSGCSAAEISVAGSSRDDVHDEHCSGIRRAYDSQADDVRPEQSDLRVRDLGGGPARHVARARAVARAAVALSDLLRDLSDLADDVLANPASLAVGSVAVGAEPLVQPLAR